MKHLMSSPLWLRTGLFIIAAGATLSGCAADPFDAVALRTMNAPAVGRTLGPAAVATPDGYSLDLQQHWPTVIHLVHVAAPDGGAARWKLDFSGRVVHLIAFQTLNVAVSYEGPLPAELLKGLRNPSPESANEFLSDFVDFVNTKVHESMTAKWTDAAALRDDPYRSRFLGLLNVTAANLRGQGRAERSRFSVDVSGVPGSSLTLRYLGDDLYHIELSGAQSFGPLPVL
jgi:hypothetical protein